MTQLAKLQYTFQDCVLDSNKPDSTEWISASGRAAPEIQLSIYTHAYHSRLIEVLENDYPAIMNAIGEDRFNQLAYDYIETHPSHYFSLRDFGRKLPVFIADLVQKQKDYQGMHWLYELSLFEWTLGDAFDAADDRLFSEQDMAAIPAEDWPELEFVIHPSVQRLDLEWNITEMWLALTTDEPLQINALHDTSSSPWLIWREQLITRFRSMETDEQLALDALREGKNFNQICETLTSLMSEHEIPMRAATLLKGWITQGLISGIQNTNN